MTKIDPRHSQGSDIAFAVSWTTAWRAITKLRERLITYEATWQGGFDVSALLDLQSLYANVEEQVHLNTPYQHAVIISLIACAILIALLNVGSVSMLVLLRRQIKSSVARRSHIIALQPETPAPLTFNKRDLPLATPDPLDASPNAQIIFHPSTPSSPQKHDLRPSHSNDEAEHHRFARLSLPHLPRLGMGSRKSSEATLASNGSAGWGAWKEKWSPGNMKARLAPSSPALPIDLGGRDTLLDLKRAERDLLVVSLGGRACLRARRTAADLLSQPPLAVRIARGHHGTHVWSRECMESRLRAAKRRQLASVSRFGRSV